MLKNIWRIINIKEGSCNIIYKINLTGMSILFSNKGMGRQRQPIGLSSIIYWAKKNQNCRQPKLDSSSGQIYWVISHHQYMSRSRYAGEGENYSRELQDVGDLLSKCWWAEQNNSIIGSKKINEREKKMQIWWFVGITVPEVLMMAKYTFNSPNKNTLFNILPNKVIKNWIMEARWTIEAVAKINYK